MMPFLATKAIGQRPVAALGKVIRIFNTRVSAHYCPAGTCAASLVPSTSKSSYNAKHCFSSQASSTPPPSQDDKEKNKEDEEPLLTFGDGIDSHTRKLMQNRHEGIEMNTKGISQHVLPGEYIVKTNPKTGDKKMVGLERSMGYFWDLKVSYLLSKNHSYFVSILFLIPTVFLSKIMINK